MYFHPEQLGRLCYDLVMTGGRKKEERPALLAVREVSRASA